MKCNQCQHPRHYTKFRVDTRTGKRRKICRECENLNRKKLRQSKLTPQQQFIYDYLIAHRCYACGNKNPICLDFHHLNPKEKTCDVSKMVKNGFNIDVIKTEISKCIVLCANCHRVETARVTNNYKYRTFYQ